MTTTKPVYAPWSVDEQRVLHTHYRTLGSAGCVQMLPGRTRTAVRSEAQQLGIRYDHKAAGRLAAEAGCDLRREATWREPKPRYPSVWHYAAGAAA